MSAKAAMIPVAFKVVFVTLGCTLWTVAYSFTNSRLLPKADWVGLQQYRRLWPAPIGWPGSSLMHDGLCGHG